MIKKSEYILSVISLLFAAAFFFSACHSGKANDKNTTAVSTSSATSTETKEPVDIPVKNYVDGTRTILVYICGSNLETKSGAATKNIAEMLEAKLPDNVSLLIQTGGAKAWRNYNIPADKSCRFSVQSGTLTLVEENPIVNMGVPSSLSDFVLWGAERCPAEFYTVILWDHGGGSLKGVCSDENYKNDALTLPELKSAFSGIYQKLGRKLDTVGFDACLMATLDTAQALAPYADYMIASEEVEPSGGWDYAAFLGKLNENPFLNTVELGKAICDTYIAKSEKNGKGSAVTLSLVELSKINKAAAAYNEIFTDAIESGKKLYGTQSVIRAFHLAVSFGGGTSTEGYSNLFDLIGFAEAMTADTADAKALKDALDECILYSVCGPARSGSYGLSIYYPENFEKNEFDRYLGICAFDGYKSFLSEVYGNIPATTVTFADKGSIASDGGFRITFTDESLPYISSVNFLLLEIGNDEDHIKIRGLGEDNDITASNGGKTFTSNFRGVWLALDGQPLSCMPIDDTESYTVFSAPVLLNGSRTNLRFAYIWDDTNEDGGYYQLLGTWSGINEGGFADREIRLLGEGDRVTVLYNRINANDYSSSFAEGETITIGSDGGSIAELPLSEKNYQYVFKITDIFGNTFYSSTAIFQMKYTYDELLDNPLADGQYAAEVIVISEDVDNDLAYGS